MKELGMNLEFLWFVDIFSTFPPEGSPAAFESTWNLLLLASIDPKGQHPEDVFVFECTMCRFVADFVCPEVMAHR